MSAQIAPADQPEHRCQSEKDVKGNDHPNKYAFHCFI